MANPEHLSGRRCVVTGAAGFIGSHLAGRLGRLPGTRVIALDSLVFGSWGNLAREESIRRETADLRELDADALARLLDGTDVLFHLAAQKLNNAESRQALIDCNFAATDRLFTAAARAGVRRIIFSSSLYAYGRMSGPPMDEAERPEPRTLYGVTKLAGEGLLREASRQHGVEGVSVRLFFVYGPRQFAGSGYPSVIVRNFDRLLRGEPPRIHGDGTQSLDYVFVDDVVDALIRATTTDPSPGVVNIGSGRAVSINDLTRVMSEVAGFEGEPVHDAPDWTAGSHRQADTRRAAELLGWQATTPLRTGLQAVWDDLKSASARC